jgi:hypothetical protein
LLISSEIYSPVGGGDFRGGWFHVPASVLGLDRTSSVLRAYLEQQPEALNIFSFAYEDQETGEGENLFSLGGYAGLDPTEIIWMDNKPNNKPNNIFSDGHFSVELPYVWYKGHRISAVRGHSAVVDTGASIGILHKSIMTELFWYERAFVRALRPRKPNGKYHITHIYDSNVYPGGRTPAMAIRMGGTEWLSEVVDWEVETSCYNGQNGTPLVGPFHGTTFISTAEAPFDVAQKRIPSVVGATFLNKLKGLVFDFTPNKERVGFVPRYKFTTTTGLVNPLGMRSGATSGLGGVYSKTAYLAGSFVMALFLYISF